MADQIDHTAEALSLIDTISVIGYANDDGYRKQEFLAVAQVHATLALVEQARIANLIALYSIDTGLLTREKLPGWAASTYDALTDKDANLQPDIAAALKIGDPS